MSTSDPNCPCGLTGENCTELVDGLKSLDQALQDFCSPDFSGGCIISDTQGASCDCDCGYEGDLCDEKIDPLSFNWVLCILIPLMVILLALNRIGNLSEYNKEIFSSSPKGLVEPNYTFVSPKLLLIFRLLMLMLGLVVLGRSLDRAGILIFGAFTIWNWTFFTCIFLSGFALSMKHHGIKYEDASVTDSDLDDETFSSWEQLHYIAVEVEFPSTILIALVVWVVLLPVARETDDEGRLLHFNSYMFHAANVGFMYIEILCTNIKIHIRHFWYVLLWVGCYSLFHGVLMVIFEVMDEPHCPVYPFLNLGTPFFVAWLLGVLVPLPSGNVNMIK
eukprot:maker-scaffold_3-snap-gene-21.6-mRNA-1 protein AED:0.27 eAED:0.27 QI:126/0.33/0.25/1/1/1/4/0/332